MKKFAITFIDWNDNEAYLQVIEEHTDFIAAKAMSIFDEGDQKQFLQLNSFWELSRFVEEVWNCTILIEEVK